MPDTGAPWEIPYLDGTELVRGYPAFSEDLAEQVADGLSAAGGLVAVKHVLKTNTFSSGTVSAGSNVAVPDLEIVHEVADENNSLIITAYFGSAGTSAGLGLVGIAVAEDGALLALGDAEGSRTRVSAGGRVSQEGGDDIVTMPSVTFVHTPGAGEKTYTVRAININAGGRTLFVNRSEFDFNNGNRSRAASALVIQEVKV